MRKIYLSLLACLLSLYSFAQYSTYSFTYGGLTRQYLLYIPPTYDGTTAVPFLLVLHGLGDNMNNFAGVRFEDVADTANFIFAIPQAIVDPTFQASAWNSGASYLGITLNPTVDDVGFLNALIDTVASQYLIDQTRLYSTGFSMGGFMTNRLGCELNNRIAAIASVSGTIGASLTCTPTRVVPACHFHGTDDQTVAYTGDMYGSDPEALVAFWRGHDRCDSVPSVIDTLPHVSTDSLHVVHYVYPHGAYGSDVEFYKILKGQHQWLGPTGEDINYTVAIRDFFNRYKWLPQTAAGISVVSPVDVRIFPNPASAELHISLEGSSGRDMQVFIMDIMGRAVYATVGTGDIQINTANFAKGVYTVAVIADGQKITKKICLAD